MPLSTTATRTPAPPSEPNAHYVLVSTREHGNSDGPVEFRSYRIIDGVVTEEEVATTPSDTPAQTVQS